MTGFKVLDPLDLDQHGGLAEIREGNACDPFGRDGALSMRLGRARAENRRR
jgi:hypothetical protein